MPWSFPMDVFSFGCLTFELLSGCALLPLTDDMRRMLICMERVIGPFKRDFANATQRAYPTLFSVNGPVRVMLQGDTDEEIKALKSITVG